MQYKYKYKDTTEREAILDGHKELFLIEEQNITEGNFLIFSDIQPSPANFEQDAASRISDISTYLSSNTSAIPDVENLILDIEQTKIINGGM
jgi:hypothetical protein